jgi:hypothetical protein
MGEARITGAARARQLLEEIQPELLRILENAPIFGSAGISLTFYEGQITSIDLSATVKRRLPNGGRA